MLRPKCALLERSQQLKTVAHGLHTVFSQEVQKLPLAQSNWMRTQTSTHYHITSDKISSGVFKYMWFIFKINLRGIRKNFIKSTKLRVASICLGELHTCSTPHIVSHTYAPHGATHHVTELNSSPSPNGLRCTLPFRTAAI